MLLLLAVATALADSSVVTLALPDILRRFNVEIGEVSRVLTSYNAILALGAVPAAYIARRAAARRRRGRHHRVRRRVGGVRPGRVVRRAAGRALHPGRRRRGSWSAPRSSCCRARDGDAAAARSWAAAGVAGAAVGPAVGGALTQLAGWEWIFLLQAPIAFAALFALLGDKAYPPFQTRTGARPVIRTCRR